MARRAASPLIVGTVRRRRRSLLCGTALQAVAVLAFATSARSQPAPNARPAGGQVVAGTASIGRAPTQTTIDQSSQRAAINWQNFDVGSQQTVRFNQPNANAVTLNRVLGPDPSQIAGQVIANGNIIITNPSGVTFHQGAQVDANSLIVSAPGISNRNFMAGRMVFDRAPKPGARVSNAGTITVKQTGLAALVAPQVANSGTINAKLGRVVLAGAEAHTIDLYGDGLVSIDVTRSVRTLPLGADGRPVTALVTNTGTVIADGGSVLITAKAADGLVQNLVNAGGNIRANSIGDRTGTIAIAGVGGSVRVEGRVSAIGRGGARGGTVTVDASDTVTVAPGARLSANGGGGGGTVVLGTTTSRALAGRQAAASGAPHGPATPAGTARRVVVADGATVSADGIGDGSGGVVSVLSTGASTIDGFLTARGGKTGGNGGFIEASSDRKLTLTTAPDLSAPSGHGGTLYLDPYDLIVGTGRPAIGLSGSSTDPNVPTDSATSGTSYISPATLESASRNGAVTITLNANHDLTVQQAINLAQGTTSMGGATGGSSLTLNAGNNLSINANITLGNLDANGSTPTLTLTAGNTLTIAPSVAILTVGNITMTATANTAGAVVIGDGSSITTPSAILIQAGNTVSIGSNVSLSAGPLGYFPQYDSYVTGIEIDAGGDVKVGSNSSLSVRTTSDGASGSLVIDSGGNVSIGGGSTLSGDVFTDIAIYSGDTFFQFGVPPPNPNGSITLAGSITGAGRATLQNSYRDSTTGASGGGSITLLAGSLVTAVNGGTVSLYPNDGGGSLGGTIGSSGAGGSVSLFLSSSGTITEPASGSIYAYNVTGSATSIDLSSPANQISQIGVNNGDSLEASAGNVSVTSSIPLLVGGLTSTGGGIQVGNGGTITLRADQLTIGTGLQFSRTTEGSYGYALYAPGGTVALQPLTASVPVELVTGGATTGALSISRSSLDQVYADRLVLGSATNTGGVTVGSPNATLDLSSVGGGAGFIELDLVNAGAIGQASGSAIVVDTLAANGGTVTLLGQNNQIGSLGASSASGTVFQLSDAIPLSVSGPVTAPNGLILIRNDNLCFCGGGSLSAQTVQLAPLTPTLPIRLEGYTSTGGALQITQSMLNQITAGTLVIGEAGDTGGITVGLGGDAISIGGAPAATFLNSGAIAEADGSSLTVGSLLITGGGAAIAPPTSITLVGANQIGTVAGAASGTISISNAGALTIDSLQSLQAGVSVTTTAGDLTVAKTSTVVGGQFTAISGTGVTLHAGGNLIFAAGAFPSAATVGTNTLQLVAGGDIEQNAGTLSTATLLGFGNNVTLTQAGNQITALDEFTAQANFSLSDAHALLVDSTVSVGNGATLSLASDAITFGPSGDLSAPGGTVALAPLTPGTNFALSSFAPSGVITANTLRVGSLTSGTITIAGNFDFSAVNTLDLRSGAAITEDPASSIKVGALTGQATSATLRGNNLIGTLGAFTTTSGLVLNNAQALTVTGPVTDSTSIAIAATNSLISTGNISAPTVSLTAADGSSLGTFTQESGSITAATQLSLVASGGISQTNATVPGGSITAGLLTGSASSGAVSLTGANTITTLSRFSSASGFTLVDARSLAVAGPVTDQTAISLTTTGGIALGGVLTAPSITLSTTGAITQPGGALIAARLTGNAASAGLDSPNNQIGTLGGFTTTGSFSLSDASTLTIGGAVSVGGGQTLSLASDSITFGAGGSLSAAGGTVALAPLTPGAPFVLSSFAPTGTVTANTLRIGSLTAGDITVSGNYDFSAVNTLDLRSAGTVLENSASTIQVATLTGQANAASLTGDNAIGTLGSFATHAGFTLHNAQTLTVAGPVTDDASITISASGNLISSGVISAPLVSLAAGNGTVPGSFTQTAGTITASTQLTLSAAAGIGQTGGSIVAGTLTGSASQGAVSLTGGNAIGTLGAFASYSGFTLNDGQTLTVTGPVTDATRIGLSVAGALTLDGALTAPTVSLAATGAITQPGGGITATALIGSAASADLSSAANQITMLGRFTTGGNFNLSDASPLTIGGTVSVGAGQTLSLASDSITFGQGGSLVAPGGTVALAPLTVGAGFVLSSFAPTGTVVADTLRIGSLTTGDISVSGTYDFSSVTTLDLRSAGAITEDAASSIQVGTLTGQANTASLAGANRIGTLASFATTAGLTLTNAQTLTVAGPVTDGAAIALTVTGGLVLDGTLSAPSVSLTASGGITQPGGGITAATLTGSTGSSAASFTASGNAIAALGAFTSGTGFALNDGQTLTVTGPVADGSRISLTTSGALTLNGTLAAPTVSLAAGGAITQPGGSIATALLIGNAASAVLGQAGNQVTTLGTFTTTGSFSLADGSPLAIGGAVSVGGGQTLSLASNSISFGEGASLTAQGGVVALAPLSSFTPFALSSFVPSATVTADTLRIGNATTGDIAISGTYAFGGVRTLDLRSAGAIVESASSTITVDTLTAQANSVSLLGNNGIATVGAVGTTAGFALNSLQPLVVAGPVTDQASVAITSSGALTLSGAISAPLVTLSAGSASTPGGILQTGGSVTASTQLSLAAVGDIAQTGGTITAGLLTGATSAGAVSLTGANAIGRLGSFASVTGFSLADGQSLTVTGPVGDARSINLSVNGTLALNGVITAPTVSLLATGDITEQGSIAATTLANLSATNAQLTGANRFATLGTFTVGNALTISDLSGLTLSGTGQAPAMTLIAGGAVNLAANITAQNSLTVNAAGSISQTSGVLSVGTLSGTAQNSATFGDASSALVGALGAFTVRVTSGSPAIVQQASSGAGPAAASVLRLLNATGLTVTGPLSAGTVTLSSAGAMTLNGGAISADVANLTVQAGNNGASFTQLGTTNLAPNSLASGQLAIALPGGGTVSLANLTGPAIALTLNLGGGVATGALDVASLQVSGTGGGTALTGTVAGQTGASAASVSTISPAIDTNYQLNGCTIGVGSCGVVFIPQPGGLTPAPAPEPSPAPAAPPAPFSPLLVTDADVALLVPKSFLDSTLGNILKTNLFTADLITVGILRDPTDPELLLPNISDRDY